MRLLHLLLFVTFHRATMAKDECTNTCATGRFIDDGTTPIAKQSTINFVKSNFGCQIIIEKLPSSTKNSSDQYEVTFDKLKEKLSENLYPGQRPRHGGCIWQQHLNKNNNNAVICFCKDGQCNIDVKHWISVSALNASTARFDYKSNCPKLVMTQSNKCSMCADDIIRDGVRSFVPPQKDVGFAANKFGCYVYIKRQAGGRTQQDHFEYDFGALDQDIDGLDINGNKPKYGGCIVNPNQEFGACFCKGGMCNMDVKYWIRKTGMNSTTRIGYVDTCTPKVPVPKCSMCAAETIVDDGKTRIKDMDVIDLKNNMHGCGIIIERHKSGTMNIHLDALDDSPDKVKWVLDNPEVVSLPEDIKKTMRSTYPKPSYGECTIFDPNIIFKKYNLPEISEVKLAYCYCSGGLCNLDVMHWYNISGLEGATRIAYKHTCEIDSTDRPSGLVWWIIMLIVLGSLILVVLCCVGICCCCKKKRSAKRASTGSKIAMTTATTQPAAVTPVVQPMMM